MVNFSGVGSGIDFGNITKQLVAIEKLPEQAITTRQSGAKHRVALFGDLSDKLRALNTAATNLDDAKKIRSLSANSTRTERLGVTANGAADAGTYDITVDSLAAAEVSQSSTFASDTAGIAGTGTLTLTVGTNAAVNVDFDSTMSLSDIANQINQAGAGATANVLFDGTRYRLMVTANEMGTKNAITFAETGSSLGFNAPGAELVAASDAKATINNVQVTRSDNTLDDVIPGVTFDLKSLTPTGEGTTRVTIAPDNSALKSKVQAFVDAVNSVQSFINAQLGSDTLDPASSLRGDATVQGLQRQISTMLGTGYTTAGVTRSLGTFGITMDNSGALTVDSAKFDAAVATSSSGLVSLLSGDSGGLTGAVKALTDSYSKASTGLIASVTKGINDRIRGFDDQIQRIEDRASALEARLQKQFSAADSLIGTLNSQMTYISKIFG
ncbi:MAG: flagellar filament capping protein FliD [Myxococcota bacterium]